MSPDAARLEDTRAWLAKAHTDVRCARVSRGALPNLRGRDAPKAFNPVQHPRGRLSPAARPLHELLRLGREGLKLRVIGKGARLGRLC